DAAEAYVSRSEDLEIKVRDGRVERSESSGGIGCGVRVEKGARQGFASTTDLSRDGIHAVVEAAPPIAARVPDGADGRLPDPRPSNGVDPEIFDPSIGAFGWERTLDLARRVESGARAVDPRVTPGEGSTASTGAGQVAVASTRGIAAAWAGTRCSLGCAPVAAEGQERQRQVWHEARRFLADLPEPEAVGRPAAGAAPRATGGRP